MWQKALGGAAVAMVVAGCGTGGGGGGAAEDGFASSSAEEIVAATEKDMLAVRSLRMSGELVEGAERFELDMRVSTSGDCTGWMSAEGGRVRILSLHGVSWMKPDADFWQATAGGSAKMVQSLVGDKWVVLPRDEKGFTALCDLDGLLSEFAADAGSRGEVEGTEVVAGQDTVKVLSKTEEGDPLAIWITVDDPHHIVRMEVAQGAEPGTLEFSAFDRKLGLKAPGATEVIDLANQG